MSSIEERLAAMERRMADLEAENQRLRAESQNIPEKEPDQLSPMERVKIKELARDTHRLMSIHGSKGYDMAMTMHGRPVARRGRKRS